MGFFGMTPKDDVKDPKTQVQPGGPVIVKAQPAAAIMKPALGLSVNDDHPKLSSRLTFERRAVRDTLFKLHAAEFSVANFKSYQGYAVEASRKDGRITTKAMHDFGSADTSLDLGIEEKRNGVVMTANYAASVKAPSGGIISATIKSGPNKLAASHLLSKNLSAVVLTREEVRGDGLYTASTSINSEQAVRLGLSKKVVKNGSTDIYGLSYVLPSLATASYKHDCIAISATTPVTTAGVGATKLMVVWEPTFSV